jgi:hypothetical protein
MCVSSLRQGLSSDHARLLSHWQRIVEGLQGILETRSPNDKARLAESLQDIRTFDR